MADHALGFPAAPPVVAGQACGIGRLDPWMSEPLGIAVALATGNRVPAARAAMSAIAPPHAANSHHASVLAVTRPAARLPPAPDTRIVPTIAMPRTDTTCFAVEIMAEATPAWSSGRSEIAVLLIGALSMP